MGTKDLLEQRNALLTDLAAAYAREDALKRECDALRVEVARLSASKERLREVYECAVAMVTRDRNGRPVYPHSWLKFDPVIFGADVPPFRLTPTWETPVGLLSDVPTCCDVVPEPSEAAAQGLLFGATAEVAGG